ncbi:MAG: FG-GAP repeat domain-containing protein, partial [Flavobacteriales bacterium]
MKYLYKPAMLVASLMVWLGGSSQVSFTNQGGMLQAIGGGSYEDCAVDMNSDNLDDVVRVTGNGVYIDYQNGDGTFTGVYYPVAFTNQPSWSIAAGDLTGNGFTDLLFGDSNAVSFVLASDDGTSFTEYADPEYIFSQRTTLQDIDLDGNLDAFVCHDVDLSHPYRNDGNGIMTEDQTLINTLPVGGNYAAIWCDYDGDSDLYLTKCRGGAPYGDERRTNLHYRNNGDGTFSEVGALTGLNDHNNSWATVFEDFDNDGDFDTFTVNHS